MPALLEIVGQISAMTTIACKDLIMACDSCWTDANWLQGTSQTKIIRLKSGALLGEAGDNDSRAVVKLLQNCKKYDNVPSALELAACKVDYCALLLLPNGELVQIAIDRAENSAEDTYYANAWRVNKGGSAVGSGGSVAIGAMDAGKSAREAVEIACRRDPNSKAPVHAVALKVEPKKAAGK